MNEWLPADSTSAWQQIFALVIPTNWLHDTFNIQVSCHQFFTPNFGFGLCCEKTLSVNVEDCRPVGRAYTDCYKFVLQHRHLVPLLWASRETLDTVQQWRDTWCPLNADPDSVPVILAITYWFQDVCDALEQLNIWAHKQEPRLLIVVDNKQNFVFCFLSRGFD